MIEVKVGLDGTVTPAKIVLGNKWENNDEQIHFDLPSTFDNHHKYVISVIKQSTGNTTVTLPVQEGNIYSITNKLTRINGNWSMYLMCREQPLDLENESVDVQAQKSEEHVFISNVFTGTVNNNLIDQDAVNDTTLDANLKPIYDELLLLKKSILDQISGNDKLNGSYNDLEDKPSINDIELSGNKGLYDFGYLPIHSLSAKSFSALYKAIKTTGLSLDEEDVSTFLFALASNEIEGSYDGKFVELNIMNIYKAEYNPFINQAIVSCSDFTMTLKAEGIMGYEVHSQGSSMGSDDSKLDVYQGVENAGKMFKVGDDGYITLIESSDAIAVNESDLDSVLEEVYANG